MNIDKEKAINVAWVILVGALGSGFWELLKPLLNFGWNTVLTLSTLGLSSLRDSIYKEAMLISPPRFDESMYYLASILMATTVLASKLVIRRIPIENRRISENQRKSLQRVERVLFIFTIIFFILAFRAVYVKQLRDYIHTLEVIATPHISDMELKKYKALEIQIKNRADYLKFKNILRQKIQAAGESVPERDFF